MKSHGLKVSMVAAPAMLACALLGSGAQASAQASEHASTRFRDDERCTNRSLHGKYAFAIEGLFVDAPTPLPLRGVAMTHFDGRGNLSQVDHVVFNGTPPPLDWTPATGTYNINPDCTGEAEIIIPGSPFSPVILRLVVADNGTQILTVVSKPGYAVTSRGTRVHESQ
jgi:hypothetical protein